ncbi:MAG TPA: alpha/beta fold hydrolase [Sphingomonas sp.]|jgi:pimeloyl-ACP methyl ester carboxylesterase|nr:alpha/beta fold hydrolase [Sphingomonas sp.]
MTIPESRFIDAAAARIHYRELGEGAPLILIHGGGPGATGWSNWNRNVAVLARHRRVIVPDLPGFGQSSERPRGTVFPGWWATPMLELLDALGIASADFVGNSLGGSVTLKIALEAPERIGRMILMGTGGSFAPVSPFPTAGLTTLRTFYQDPGPSIERLRGFIGQFVYDPGQITEALIAERFEAAMTPSIVANPPMQQKPGDPPPEDLWRDPRLTKLPHRTLMIWGREDRVMPLDCAFPLLKQIPDARLYVIPRCGHWAQWEHADEFNATVLNFLGAD